MDENEYVQSRLDDQIAWYDRKCRLNHKWYKALRVIELVAAASVPFLAGYITDTSVYLKVIVGFLGLLIASITGLMSLYHFQELWIQYRITCETLKYEKYLFLTKTDPYDIDKPLPLLVKRVEALASEEHIRWVQYLKSPRRKESSNG